MDWLKERKRILDVFDKYPSKRGSRTDIHSDNTTYDRRTLISDELNGLFRHGNKLPQVYEMILNDTDTQFFTKGLIKYNWSIPGAYKIYKNKIKAKRIKVCRGRFSVFLFFNVQVILFFKN